MLEIKSKIPSKNLEIYKGLSRLIQGYFYYILPQEEHLGYTHNSGKIFKKTNFCFTLKDGLLHIKFSALEKELEEMVAVYLLKNGLKLGEIHIIDTIINLSDHSTNETNINVKGCVVCNIKGLLDKKVYLEPNDSRHLEMMTKNLIQKYETFYNKAYDDEVKIELLWQDFDKFQKFYYGNNKNYMKAWLGVWNIKADNNLINLALSTGLGSGVMSYGCGFVEKV
ncbi:CRISPR-associated protein Cas6 [Campylobacter sp. FMV-PI01]|uniref:CRISPR-associated protein Cas6 n=1 Tax=Campylobacter portucalensis TaxID=2608384 RepID=A0A6L5WFI1_9BACT|nr:CRISPR-associated endoribonuclease Cas6 [Campylobacter portucalensis]MSN95798.1 CRISPR-associated protein Cas6 [Campylobacter portucalensis]